MAVRREKIIEWDGAQYTIIPSMRILRSIESEGISIMSVGAELAKGKPQASLMAFIVGTVMRHAGAKVTDDELCGEFMRGDIQKVMALYGEVIEAISPEAPAAKKPAAPEA